MSSFSSKQGQNLVNFGLCEMKWCVCALVYSKLLPIFIPLQANCCGEAAGFQVITSSQVDEQNEIRWKNTLIFEHEFPVYLDACLNF